MMMMMMMIILNFTLQIKSIVFFFNIKNINYNKNNNIYNINNKNFNINNNIKLDWSKFKWAWL